MENVVGKLGGIGVLLSIMLWCVSCVAYSWDFIFHVLTTMHGQTHIKFMQLQTYRNKRNTCSADCIIPTNVNSPLTQTAQVKIISNIIS